MNTSRLFSLPTEHVHLLWKDCIAWLAPAIERSRGTWTNETVLKAIMDRDLLLWASVRNGIVEAAAVSQIVIYPEVKVLALPFVGGKNRNNWLIFEPTFIEYGLENGCTEFEGYMRRGWIGMSRKPSGGVLGNDWEDCWTVVRKRLTPSINKDEV